MPYVSTFDRTLCVLVGFLCRSKEYRKIVDAFVIVRILLYGVRAAVEVVPHMIQRMYSYFYGAVRIRSSRKLSESCKYLE